MKKALKLMARKEAILLDPVYSGKAFDGLIGLVKKGHFKDSDKILFIHTGGSAAIPAYEWAF
jgi:1-aminocyclopropane-1-carboxylate deaminase/D-cysteine desulfhydrase-like pyridoxal-dependent ACC family enzyme